MDPGLGTSDQGLQTPESIYYPFLDKFEPKEAGSVITQNTLPARGRLLCGVVLYTCIDPKKGGIPLSIQ